MNSWVILKESFLIVPDYAGPLSSDPIDGVARGTFDLNTSVCFIWNKFLIKLKDNKNVLFSMLEI